MNAVVALAWAEFRRWDTTAIVRKTFWSRAKGAFLIGGFAALVLGPFAKVFSTAGWLPKVLIGLSSAITALVAFGSKLIGPDRTQPWLRARILAEHIRGEIYRVVTGTATYDAEQLGDKVEELRKQVDFVPERLDKSGQPAADEPRPPTFPLDAGTYEVQRLEDQIAWFNAKSSDNADQVKLGTWVANFFGGLLVLIGLPATFFSKWDASDGWGAIISGAAAMLAGQLYSGRYEFLARLYGNASFRLAKLKLKLELAIKRGDVAKQRQLIAEAENVLLDVNNTWLTEWTKQDLTDHSTEAKK